MHDEAWFTGGNTWSSIPTDTTDTWSILPEDKTVPGTKMERRQWGTIAISGGARAGWQTPIPTGKIVKIFGFIKVR